MLPRCLALCATAIVLLVSSIPAGAQSGTINLRSTMKLSFDCETPWNVKNYGVTGRFNAALNSDKTATADLKISGFFLNGDVHFDARLGRGAMPAPGGTSQLRVIGPNRLRGVWSLPNNDFILDVVATSNNTCAVNLALKLKPGKKQYSMFGGQKFYYCSAARIVSTTCAAQ
ncbi:MAG: hypothetical protein HY242_17625 [Afipia sp.]|nr:hypothetical protein [Afipia sp.]